MCKKGAIKNWIVKNMLKLPLFQYKEGRKVEDLPGCLPRSELCTLESAHTYIWVSLCRAGKMAVFLKVEPPCDQT